MATVLSLSVFSPSGLMANLGLTTPDQLFTSITTPIPADLASASANRPRSSSSTPSPRRHKRQASLPSHGPQFELSPARIFNALITASSQSMKNVNTDVQKPLVEGPKRQMGKYFSKSGYLVPSPPSTSGSGKSTASEQRQTAGKQRSKENTDAAKPPAAMQVEQTPGAAYPRQYSL